jgi:outer membrane lipoprotein-sorting protein
MTKHVTRWMAALTLVSGFAVAQGSDERGLEIARKLDAFNNGYQGETSTMEMVLISAHGDQTTRKLNFEQIETASDGDRARIEFRWPADVQGTRVLTWTHRKGDDDQWLYLPSVQRVKRISSGNKSGSFMGSEFSYEDLASPEVDKFTHKFVSEGKLEGRDTWTTERVPVGSGSGYSKLVSWFDKEYLQPLKVEYYDRKGELLKVATFSGYSKFGKWYRAASIEMDNRQSKKKSILRWSNRKLEAQLRAKQFESDGLAD